MDVDVLRKKCSIVVVLVVVFLEGRVLWFG